MNVFTSKVDKISPSSSLLYIANSLDVTSAFIGNVFTTSFRKLSLFGLLLWVVNLILSFSFDFYEAHLMYGFAWGTVKAVELMVFCMGSYFIVFKTIPWIKNGLTILENDEHKISYGRSLLKMTISVKRLQSCLLIFSIIGGIIQFLLIKFVDKSDHVTFNQSLPAGSIIVFNICRFVSGVHMLYSYGLFWCVASTAMTITGYSMIEFQDRISTNLRSKASSPSFRDAVIMFNERLNFVRRTSGSCLALIFSLLCSTLLSFMVNIYLFLYKKRFIMYIWHALMPLGLAIYPMCIASWVTKQYHWYFVAVVKAWAEYPEDTSSDESDNETDDLEKTVLRKHCSSPDLFQITEPRMRVHTPKSSQDHVSMNALITDWHDKEKLRKILRGSIRVVGKLQRHRKISQPRFNFERYISYLSHVAPRSGFKIGSLTITWEKVSKALFVLISIVAVFLQETIFGNRKSQVEL